MAENFRAKIIDFNPRRMDPQEARVFPAAVRPFVADWRQYPLHIGQLLPKDVAWFDPGQPWYFRDAILSPNGLKKLDQAQTMILTGSGMSAYQFQNLDFQKGPPEFSDTLLMIMQKQVKNFLGEGKSVLAICFGGQLGVHALGGRIGRLPQVSPKATVTEAGWLEQRLTKEGKRHPVLGQLPERFSAPHFHSDYVDTLPPVGHRVKTDSGPTTVVRSEVLAVRNGYLSKDGLHEPQRKYIMAAEIETDSGGTLLHVQYHPEMAVSGTANFLVRRNKWLADEMGRSYYEQALQIPKSADLSVAKIIPDFVTQARERYEQNRSITFARSSIAQNYQRLLQYMIE